METILENVRAITWQMLLMWCIGGGLIYLAIRKNMEPALLLPMGFGAILVNLPFSGAITQSLEAGPLDVLFQAGIANELFPLLLFIGIGAMIDFGPLLADPKLLIFGAAAQAGIFLTLILASALGFPIREAASIAVIAAADGPTSIFVANYYSSKYLGAIMQADLFLAPDTLLILGLGLAGFVLDTAGGVLVAKLVNLFLPEGKKVNPMIGAAGISAFPMSARIVHKMGQQEDNQNFLLMHAVAVNVSGQIASVLAAGALLTLVP